MICYIETRSQDGSWNGEYAPAKFRDGNVEVFVVVHEKGVDGRHVVGNLTEGQYRVMAIPSAKIAHRIMTLPVMQAKIKDTFILELEAACLAPVY